MSGPGGPAARLIGTTLWPERRRASLVLVLLLASFGLRLAMPVLLGVFVDGALDGRPVSDLWAIAGLYVAAALVAEGLQLVVTWEAVQLSWRAGNRLRERLAAHAVRLDLAWHGRHSPGQLIERVDGDVEALAVFFTNVFVHVVGNALLMVGIVVVGAFIDPWAGLVLAGSAVAGMSVLVGLRRVSVPAREAEREASAVLYGDLEERLGGLEDLRANGAGDYAVHRLHVNAARAWRAGRRSALLGDGSYAAAGLSFASGSIAMLTVGFLLADQGAITTGQVITLFRYSEMIRMPLERIAEQLSELHKALAGARRAATLLATETTLPLPAVPRSVPAGALALEFDEVEFAYRPGDPSALHGLTLSVEPGHRLGIVGRTGSGKTTLARLALRLWDPTAGAVRVGGVDVRELDQDSLRYRVAVVTQDVEILAASLRDNLTLFGTRPADDDQLRQVLLDVGLGRWLDRFPDGLDTPLATGRQLSSGEAQLLAFARAFLARPGLVVLDEASSRLDPATEAEIGSATRRLLDGRTAVVIAHRLDTLADVHEIAVLEHGHLVERGPRELLADDPASRFASLLRTARRGLLVDDGPAPAEAGR